MYRLRLLCCRVQSRRDCDRTHPSEHDGMDQKHAVPAVGCGPAKVTYDSEAVGIEGHSSSHLYRARMRGP